MQGTFVLTARDRQWERFLPALIPEKHLHREVTENETQLDFFFSPAQVTPSQKKSSSAHHFL